MSIPAEWVYEHQRDKALEQVAELEARVAELEHENTKLRLDAAMHSWDEAEAREDEFAVSFLAGAEIRTPTSTKGGPALSLSNEDGFVMVTNLGRVVVDVTTRWPRRSARAIMTFSQFKRVALEVLSWEKDSDLQALEDS